MSKCSEFAVFKVSKENKARIIELSLSIFKEMNSKGTVITAHEILQKTDEESELCWHLQWISQDAAKETTAKWPSRSLWLFKIRLDNLTVPPRTPLWHGKTAGPQLKEYGRYGSGLITGETHL